MSKTRSRNLFLSTSGCPKVSKNRISIRFLKRKIIFFANLIFCKILFYEKDLLEIMCHMKEDTRRIQDEDQNMFLVILCNSFIFFSLGWDHDLVIYCYYLMPCFGCINNVIYRIFDNMLYTIGECLSIKIVYECN